MGKNEIKNNAINKVKNLISQVDNDNGYGSSYNNNFKKETAEKIVNKLSKKDRVKLGTNNTLEVTRWNKFTDWIRKKIFRMNGISTKDAKEAINDAKKAVNAFVSMDNKIASMNNKMNQLLEKRYNRVEARTILRRDSTITESESYSQRSGGITEDTMNNLEKIQSYAFMNKNDFKLLNKGSSGIAEESDKLYDMSDRRSSRDFESRGSITSNNSFMSSWNGKGLDTPPRTSSFSEKKLSDSSQRKIEAKKKHRSSSVKSLNKDDSGRVL